MNNTSPINFTSPWVWAIPLISAIGITSLWASGTNETLFMWLNSLGMSKAGSLFWANATVLGDALLIFALLSLFVRHRPEMIWVVIIAAVLAIFWVHGMKYVVGHPRPGAVLSGDAIHVIGVSLRGGSFPSGHTTSAFVLAGVICQLRIHTLLSWLAVVLATLAGISRAVVGAHWPMDIFAGAISGWVIAIIAVLLFQRLAKRRGWEKHVPGQLFFHVGLLIIAISLFFYDNGYPASLPLQYTVATIAIVVNVFNLSQILFSKNKQSDTG